jgi:hypothetical protein
MKRFSRIDVWIILGLVVLGVCLFIRAKIDSQDFYGVQNLDRNRNSAETWLSVARSRSELRKRFGLPSNDESEDVWVWLFDEESYSDRSSSSLTTINYGGDGFWIQLNGDMSDGYLKSVSGNIEEFEQVIKRMRSNVKARKSRESGEDDERVGKSPLHEVVNNSPEPIKKALSKFLNEEMLFAESTEIHPNELLDLIAQKTQDFGTIQIGEEIKTKDQKVEVKAGKTSVEKILTDICLKLNAELTLDNKGRLLIIPSKDQD